MKYFYLNHNSSDLIVFFAGWGCDYNQFTNLHDVKDVLILKNMLILMLLLILQGSLYLVFC